MSGLLKAELAGAHSRPFGLATSKAAPAGPAGTDPFASFEQRIGELEAELAALEKAVPGLVAEAREEGRKEGLEERDEAAAKKLALIEAGLTEAIAGWTQRLEAMNALSVQVASTVIQKMTGNPDWRGDFLAHAIAVRLAALDASTVIAVKLSPADISAEEITALNADSKIVIEASNELEAGQCIIALQMGEIELGPAVQWRRAAKLLDALAGDPC